MGMSTRADGTNKTHEVCGTAFTIGGGNYLTAGHVWAAASSYPLQAIGLGMTSRNGAESLIARRILHATVFDTVDVAVLQVGIAFGRTFPWSAKRIALFDPIRAFGYPFAFDVESEALNVRGFQGEVVGGRNMQRLPGTPLALELSFPCPRGLSGAPLIRHADASEIVGMVLGNEITEMTVFSERETLAELGQERHLIKTEALHLGVAIRASEILSLDCAMLGGTVEAWLSAHGIPVSAE
jgi:hypothetical protein